MPQSAAWTAAQMNTIFTGALHNPPPCLSLFLSLAVFLSIRLPLSLFSPTSIALSFSVDKLSESLTTQPGKIARSHAARQVYP